MMDMPLLPCPFCAGTPELQDHRTIWCVNCNCGACVLGERAPEPDEEMPDDYWDRYKQTAVTAWNRRVKP